MLARVGAYFAHSFPIDIKPNKKREEEGSCCTTQPCQVSARPSRMATGLLVDVVGDDDNDESGFHRVLQLACKVL